jgi:non-ribosomal peptide synthetase component F/surfactin synthase thioesterase subunit/acyl carrier protein
MKNIKSIVPLLPAQQLILTATLKNSADLYVQQLLFEVSGFSENEVSNALTKLIDSYECFRSLILFEGLKQPVMVCKDDIRPKFVSHSFSESEIQQRIDEIREIGFDFQKEPCLRFDWIKTIEKKYLCITNHHILFDGWGKQVILSDFIQILKFPNIYIAEKQNKSWYDAWSNLDHKKAIESYKNYLTQFDDFAVISQISALRHENLEHKTIVSSDTIERTRMSLGLTGAELINFSWSIFASIWTQNKRVQFGVVKQNGLVNQVKNSFGMGIQTLPFQFQVDFKATIREQLDRFKSREREVAGAAFVNSIDPLFSQYNYEFLIAFENYPLDSSLGSVENEFKLLFSFDRSEFPLSLAITPYSDRFEFDWHYNTKFHSKEQITFLADQFLSFLELFESNQELTPLNLCENWFSTFNQIPQFKTDFDREEFLKKLEANLTLDQLSYFNQFSETFISSVNRIWIYGDKHQLMIPLFCAAWSQNVEVLTINEKESESFLDKLFELKTPDLIFSSVDDGRFTDSILLNQDLLNFKWDRKGEKTVNNIALSICTSGSTGEPKVVQLTLENIISFFHSWDEKLPWREKEYFASIAHPAFDIGVAELIFPLWKGWKIKLLDKSVLSDSKLLEHELSDISAFHMVPTLLESWIEGAKSDNEHRLIMTGGDKVPPHLHEKLKQKFPNAQLFQFYGPSECSVLASGFENKGQFENNLLPLGTPFNHAEVLVFGEKDVPLGPNQEGEIIVLGPAVGAGYANQNNSEKFFIYSNIPAYKTGDFGFKDENGNLFFRGRKDSQLKINGQRIELARIESALKEWSSIDNWVVVPTENMLFAFARSIQTYLPERENLQHWLPFYAIPQHIELITEFPLNKNGKVDQQQLIQYGILGLEQIQKTDTINSEIESNILELFKNKKLNFSIGWYANGLNSIDALKLSGILKTKLKIAIEINQILGAENLFKICQTKLISKSEKSDLNIIQIGQTVYSTAARLIFLSESDEQFFKSYWISSGIKLSIDFDLKKIKNWINQQSSLHLAVAFNKSEYIWKKGEIQLHEFEVNSEKEFITTVENTFSEINSSLFITFIGKSETENYLAFKVHHSLLDGLGLELVWEKLYEDLKSEKLNTIKLIAPKEEIINVDFWKNYLQDVEVSTLAFERLNSAEQKANRLNIDLSYDEKRILTELSTSYNCSLFEAGLMLFVRMMNVFKSKNQAVGIPVNTGEFVDSNHISAMSVNILPFKTEFEKVDDILKNWRELFDKRFTPFSEIAQLDKNQKNGVPFFNCTYLYHSQKSDLKEFKPIEFKRAATDFNFSLDFIEEKDRFVFAWEYRSNLFSETAIRKFHQLLFYGVEKQESKTFEKAENLQLKWNYIVEKFSDKTALFFGDKTCSYAELNKSIEEIRGNYETSERINVLILERTKESICKLLFHLIDGIPFIPVDSETATDRIERITEISKNINSSQAEFQELQYVIATSGTTGIPKLVGVTKIGYESAVQAWIEDYKMSQVDCCMQAASFSFDVSLGDIGRCFFNGASLVLLDSSERKDPTLMLEKIKQFSVTVFETTPLIARWWLADDIKLNEFPSLRLLIVGSDSWKMVELRDLIKSKSKNQRVISSYGLSETTIDNSFFDPETDDHIEYQDDMIVPVGKSMKHCQLEIFDPNGKQLTDGMEGFIAISGPAVGLGYFIDGTWTNAQKATWQSKDRGVCDEWGNFHFKGRSDRQVKVRGQRIELEEIERVLASLSPKQNWIVVDFEHEFSTEMAAFFVGNLNADDINQIKTRLIEKFPSYFLPTLFVGLEKFPLNTNGKTDASELRKIAIKNNSFNSSVKTDSETIGKLIYHFNQCFNQEIKPEENFFQFGKNSFDAMHFVRSWNKLYDEKMAVHQLFSAENFESLARVLSIRNEIKNSGNGIQKISKAQEAIWFEIKNGNSSLFNLPHFIEIPTNYEGEKIRLAFEQTLKSCSALFTRFDETEIGDVFLNPLDSSDFEIQTLEIDDLEGFKRKAFSKEFDFSSGLPFEAALIHSQDKKILYFNPHHLAYDGGSDAHLSHLFLEFYEGRKASEEILTTTHQSEPISWKSYFELITPPEIYFHKANTELQPSLILGCDNIQRALINDLTVAYQCTQTTIISHLLVKALHSIGIQINWISLALDHRTQDVVGMHMRAYPFPAFDFELQTDEIIARQKWALSQLFAAADQNIIYPDRSPIEAFHQVGLIIQHPFFVENLNLENEKIEFARPRLPLSLYVEDINERLFFRWEFDNNQLTIEKIKQLHQTFFDLAASLGQGNKSILNFKPQFETELKIVKNDDIQPEIVKIWTKYVGFNTKNTHFFEAGANSIKALLMLKEIEKSMGIKISPADFFKQPTMDFLNLFVTKSENNNLVWQLKSGDENDEIWLLPPIMGYGFIFNSLEFPNRKTLAFNYPMAMGIQGTSRIEEIAMELIRERQHLGTLPKEVTILGYSMGGLTAFEMAKWLENNGVRVKKMIILDKTAQPEPGNKIKRVSLKAELIEIAKQIASDDDDYARIIAYLKSHEQMIESYQQNGVLNCPIDVFYCSNGFEEIDFLKWKRFTKENVSLTKIDKCSHYEIPKIWNDLNLIF